MSVSVVSVSVVLGDCEDRSKRSLSRGLLCNLQAVQRRILRELTRGDREVIDFTWSRVKTKSKLTNLMNISQIEGYNGK